jgi:hypothetical protein
VRAGVAAQHHGAGAEEDGQRQAERQGVEEHEIPGRAGDPAARGDPPAEQERQGRREDGDGALEARGAAGDGFEGCWHARNSMRPAPR